MEFNGMTMKMTLTSTATSANKIANRAYRLLMIPLDPWCAYIYICICNCATTQLQ